MNNSLPTHLYNYFVKHTAGLLHDHYTRQSDNLHVISHRTQAGANCIRVRSITLWNSIEIAIKNAPSICTFQNRFKNYLVSKIGQ